MAHPFRDWKFYDGDDELTEFEAKLDAWCKSRGLPPFKDYKLMLRGFEHLPRTQETLDRASRIRVMVDFTAQGVYSVRKRDILRMAA